MSKNIIISVVGFIVATGIVIGVVGFGSDSADTDTPSQQTASQPVEAESTGVDGYVSYNVESLADAKGTERVLFFHAAWCSTCNAFEKEIEEQGVPDGITIIKANFDTDVELRKRYKVNLQSTFVLLDENDDLVQTWPFGSGLRGSISNLYEQVI